MCPNAAVGETGTVNGVVYTKRTTDQITDVNASTTCTSGITDMKYLFRHPVSSTDDSTFNEDISTWDVGKVTDMSSMFAEAKAFNQPIGNWYVKNVENMAVMFSDATAFNQPIGNWDVGNVRRIDSMFNNAKAFNQPISNWDVSSVTSMSSMFKSAIVFNQNLNNWCVKNIVSEPTTFSDNSSLSTENKPNWGADCNTLSNYDFEALSNSISIYPNPFTTDVKINLPTDIQVQSVQIVNTVGQTVYTATTSDLKLSNLPKGLYIVKINTNQGSVTDKIVKQ